MRSSSKFVVPAALCAAWIVAGCTSQPVQPPAELPVVKAPAPQSPAPVSAPVKAAAAPASSARTVDAYKHQAAEKIAAANSGALADTLPPILKSVVVLQISVDREGNPVNVSVYRSNGYKDLEQAAIASVRRAGKLPAPSSEVLGGQTTVTYLETFLFRPDGHYQIRSIASAPSARGAVAKH